METTPMMASEDVVAIVQLLERARCPVWIDGGWGVDALLGRQTRPHADLDLAIALANVPAAKDVLTGVLGYGIAQDEMPTRLELRDSQDRRIDLHPLVFDARGNGRQQLQDGSWGSYSSSGLAGSGSIGGLNVRCLSPDLQLRFHQGYEPDEDDRHDVDLLCRHFRLELPREYR
jgi:lincosamide nucleotidyltransferase A/C/D/E